MANFSSALGIRAIADQIEGILGMYTVPGPNPSALDQIQGTCARLASFDSQAGRLGERIAALAAAFYGDESGATRDGSGDPRYIEMRRRLLTAIRARADAFAANARF